MNGPYFTLSQNLSFKATYTLSFGMQTQVSLDSVYILSNENQYHAILLSHKSQTDYSIHRTEMSPEDYLFFRNTVLMTQIFKKMTFGE